MKEKFKLKTYRRAIAVAVIVVAVLLNLIVGALSDKLPLEFDLTANKVFSLTEETVAILKNMDEDVNLYYLVTKGNEDLYIEQTIDMYKGHTGKLHFSQIDPSQDPVFVNSLGIDNLTDNTIIVKCGDRVRTVDPSKLYDTTLQQQNIVAYELETKLTSAIDYVLNDTDINIVFTKGHEEVGKELFSDALYAQNATISEVDLKTEEIPADTAALYVIGPRRDFSADELQKIAAYVNGGGSLNISLDYGNDLPLVNQFMTEYYGITFDNNIVMETESLHILMNNPFYIVPQPTDHELTASMLEKEVGMVWPNTRSIQLSDKPGVLSRVLFKSSDSAVAQAASGDQVTPDADKGVKGTYAFAAAATVESDSGKVGKVVATGTSLYAADMFTSDQSVANSDFVLSTYSYLHGKSDTATLSITPKNVAVNYLALTQSDIIFYAIVFGILPPVLILAAGVFVWYKRRRL